jgi:hypothetical protein
LKENPAQACAGFFQYLEDADMIRQMTHRQRGEAEKRPHAALPSVLCVTI